ncbi:DUF6165 family protein [Oryzibacter oryziterrae]|uniref:DUF6165 family protein n=1 Tax=Oryzibacter oryziterrae TaxID=2766474 RepID=UPI002106CE56|nr:DUF6165 family protein [Oryzibacter oryziterrae]
MIEVPVSWGEMIDKITILEIKAARMSDSAKVENVRKELDLLNGKLGPARGNAVVAGLTDKLRDVNAALWDIEDEIRDCEREQDFGPRFIALARSVYFTNDKRADLKREINLELSSGIVEEKSYKPYAPT